MISTVTGVVPTFRPVSGGAMWSIGFRPISTLAPGGVDSIFKKVGSGLCEPVSPRSCFFFFPCGFVCTPLVLSEGGGEGGGGEPHAQRKYPVSIKVITLCLVMTHLLNAGVSFSIRI